MTTIFTTHGIQQLTLLVQTGETTHKVVFTVPVVYGNMGKACFTTSNKDIINALKAHPMFNVFFFVKEEFPDECNEEEAVAMNITIEDELKDPATAVYNETVTTKGMAVAYIQGMYGESFTATSVEDMKREAARRWNTLFPKWGK